MHDHHPTWLTLPTSKRIDKMTAFYGLRWTYPVQRAPALCGVWGRVLVASLILACAMQGDCDLNPGPSGHRR